MAAERHAIRRGGAWDRVAALTGLDPDLLASPGLDRWIESRSATLGVDAAEYVDRVLGDESERRRFSAQVAVPESWIGRYPASFDVVADVAARKAAVGGVFRAISIGCAAGQELVSVAIAARDAGIPAASIELHGIDRNAEAIARARSGVLPMLAMRGDLAERWSRRFRREDDGWRVPDDVQALLRFHETDALVDPWPVEDGAVDVVLCRNVLIYLSADARATLVSRACDLLASDGVLLAGHADPPRDLGATLVPLPVAGAFAWRRRTPDDEVRSSPAPRVLPRVARPRTTPVAEVARVEPAAATHTLESVRRLADAGDLARAREAADALVERIGSTADLECLLGEVASAEGRPDAAREHWRRALYLEPRHATTLEHLAVSCGTAGDLEAAAGYRRRLARLDRTRGTDA